LNTQPIQPALLAVNSQGQACSPAHGEDGDVQPKVFAATTAAFLSTLEWPTGSNARFTVLDTRFALGQRFLAAWATWREQPEPKAALDFVALEARPLGRGDLMRLQMLLPPTEWAPLAALLQNQWPALTPNLHLLTFERGRVRLLLALGDPRAWLRELVATVDAIVTHPGFDAQSCKSLARLAAPHATLLARPRPFDRAALQAQLRSAGFALHANAPVDAPFTLARYQPTFTPRLAPGRAQAHRAGRGYTEQRAVIVGAGLAGCATALALARQGWQCTVIDRQGSPALETSGNPAGLFHGVVHGHDGHHARFGRAAALQSLAWIRDVLSKQSAQDHGTVHGEANGLLRLQLGGDDVTEMQSTLHRLGLPSDYVQALNAEQVALRSGLPERCPAWFYPQGGWVQPRLLCQHWLHESQAVFIGNTVVGSIRQDAELWEVLDAQGTVLAQAPVLVLANAQHALPLLEPWMHGTDWTVEVVRGQISQLPQALADAAGLPSLPLPLTGAGYLLPRAGHGVLFGATSHSGDMEASVRESDHHHNLAQLEKLLGHPMPETLKTSNQWQGRTAWRCMTQDRLPIVGAMPQAYGGFTTDQPRLVPRINGLFVNMALGSRGITWAPLLAEVLAAGISGAVMPLESNLLDAIDPARFLARAARRTP
jgi:tRNA 5-methylaminomethyl-2-thiouridine biosynthesis bifunctional protein